MSTNPEKTPQKKVAERDLLQFISERIDVTCAEIAEHFGLSRGAISMRINKFESRELIEKRHKKGALCDFINLTKAGFRQLRA